tara:strand:+ start:11 stop:1018 length:1008 start_codon:yes stop_codon:yes gene_type:complete
MESFMEAKKHNLWDNKLGFKNGNPEGIFISESSPNSNGNTPVIKPNNMKRTTTTVDNNRSQFIKNEPPIKSPFIGTKLLATDDIKLPELIKYLDKSALFAGQWQMKRVKGQSKQEYEEFINQKAVPILDKWLEIIDKGKLIKPSAIYGYFPCGSINNELHIFNPTNLSNLGKFNFPRQRSGKRYCIADFYLELEHKKNPIDILPMQAVTMGKEASIFSKTLFNDNKYTDYLYFHGLSVQLAEACAELVHSIIRKECGFISEEPKLIKDILSLKYRGCRYSFGYPACPNVGDSRLQLKWLETERISLSIDESDQLHPEQSTTAIVSLHSQAKYFGT